MTTVQEYMASIDGFDYVRVFACEVTTGDINAFEETVMSVKRGDNGRTSITWDTGSTESYRDDTTILMRVDNQESIDAAQAAHESALFENYEEITGRDF